MSAIVSFVLSKRGVKVLRIAKKLESVVKTGKRSSVLKREGDFLLEGDFVLPVGRTGRYFCTDAHYRFFVSLCVPMVMVRLWLRGEG